MQINFTICFNTIQIYFTILKLTIQLLVLQNIYLLEGIVFSHI